MINSEELSELAKVTIAASIWRPDSVTDEPEVKLTQWRVYLVKANIDSKGDTIHFVGSVGYRYSEGRVCSPVQTYDPTTKKGITRSGRIYELVGKSGHNRDALYVWNHWLDKFNPIPEIVDLTDTYSNNSNA
jgi:hypothetical protein